jgi:anti-sigma regulatory factor (Ser/Thr protein kinase)
MSDAGRAEQDQRPYRLDLRLEPTPTSASAARRALERMGLPADLLDDAKLLATELVTNSIRHGHPRPGDLVHLRAEWVGTLRVVVWQSTPPAGPQRVAGAIRPSPRAQSGWGLYLVDQVATRWGTNLGGRPGYWFEIDGRPPR